MVKRIRRSEVRQALGVLVRTGDERAEDAILDLPEREAVRPVRQAPPEAPEETRP